MKKAIDIAKLKVLFVSGKIGADKIEQLIERSTTDARINLLKSPIAWYLEEIANEQDVFAMVKKVCAVSLRHRERFACVVSKQRVCCRCDDAR